MQQIKAFSSSKMVTNPASQDNDENKSFTYLNTLFVELESIKPAHLAPFTLYDKNNLKIVLHFGRDSPAANITVVVISVSSVNTQNTLKNFSFQAAVPKV